ncbi:type II toxin-antitoxin system VapC family toxin [Novosphingobium sp. ERW19]|uniref:type II toxin-antitoxin system VapC family toxin n=1 Tax=Novosphingobium sp. ERW19 TaxID=2726186 RepID=UPI0026799F88
MESRLRLLLDTHALIWWLAGDEALSRRALEAIADEDNAVAVSAASAMEVATKFRIGKLAQAALLAQDFEAIIGEQGFAELAISVHHARLAGEMNIAHKDPFDRLLIAQAQAEDMVLVSNEELFDSFAVKRLW